MLLLAPSIATFYVSTRGTCGQMRQICRKTRQPPLTATTSSACAAAAGILDERHAG
jgi:hypothetical protein